MVAFRFYVRHKRLQFVFDNPNFHPHFGEQNGDYYF